MKLEQRTGWGVAVAVAVALACNVGEDNSPDFSSYGGTAVSADAGDGGDQDSASDANEETSNDSVGTTGGVTAPDGSSGDQGSATTASQTTANDDSAATLTSGGSTDDGGSTDGGSSDGGEGSTGDGGMPASVYEPCNAGNTCDTPGEICLQAGAGGFCTTTCNNDGQCPAAPGGATPAGCEFLLGFPDFAADYCGMIGCGWPGNNCPAGMACTYVVQGLQVCEWL